MTEDERDDLLDRILPKGTPIWADQEELDAGHFQQADLKWWADVLGHPKAHPGCCKQCGCATTCMFGAFYDAAINTVLRELDRIGALRTPGGVQ